MAVSFRTYSAPARYGVALAGACLVILLRHSLDPALGNRFPYLLQFIAMLFAARLLGFGPGIVVLLTALTPTLYRVLYLSRPAPLDGRFWWALLFAFPFCVFLIWLLDRQGRMRAEVESTAHLAAERLEQLRAIVESSEDAIISKGLDGVIRSWNRGAGQIFGYREEEAVGQPISLVVPEDRRHEETTILERIRQGLPVKHFETVRQRKDGTLIHVSLTISPIRDARGNVVGASHIARDITERNQFEEQLRQAQKLESLGVLAGGLAHDFNNLLTGVMGNASLVVEDLGPDNPATPRLLEILKASERAAVLVRQMLAYAGKGRFVLRRLDLSAEIAEIIPLLRTSVSPSVQLEMRLAKDLPAVEADASQIQQLIMNLAINGAEAIDGSGSVVITTSTRHTDSEPQVILEVQDTGCGMDEQTRGRIFDPFFSTKFTGRGLGLAAVLGIIRSHHGSISVDTAPGAGSTFTVVLPATASPADAPSRNPQFQAQGNGHVLVVDDEDVVRNMARVALERCGYTVETASDGVRAVAAVAARPAAFQAVLLDLTMPAMGGDQALQEIHAIRPDVPIVLSSGFSEVEAVRRFADRGLAGFLQKPYTASALAHKMKEAIDQR